jgi:hypothetical protein
MNYGVLILTYHLKTNICGEMLRGAILWVIWKEKNRLTFQRERCKSVRVLGG